MRRLALAGAALAAAGLAGCGEDGDATPAATAPTRPAALVVPTGLASGEDQRAVLATMRVFAEGVRAGDADRICTQVMAPRLLRGIERLGSTCPEFLRTTAAEERRRLPLRVERVSVRGDRADVAARAADGTPRPALLVRTDAGWRLTLPQFR
jgi:hypothetical protein